jgi:hypothetical protein
MGAKVFRLFVMLASVFGFVIEANAAAFVTQRSGNWSDTVAGTRPWVTLNGTGAGLVPGAADTITISKTTVTTTASILPIGTTSIPLTAATGTYILDGTMLKFGTVIVTVSNGGSNLPASATIIPVVATGTAIPASTACKVGHVLVVDTSQSVGTGTATAIDAAQGNADSFYTTLQINTGATLTVSGSIFSNSDIILQAGGNILFSGTGPFRLHNYNSGSPPRKCDLIANGTATSHASIKGASSSSKVYLTNTLGCRNVSLNYCDFQYGDSSGNFVPVNGDETSIYINGCTFSNGVIPINVSAVLGANEDFTVTGCTFTNNSNAQALQVRSGATATGKRIISLNNFERGMGSNAGGWLNFTIDSNVFNATTPTGTGQVPIYSSAAGKWTSLRNNLIRFPTVGTSAMQACGPISNNLIICDDSTHPDPNCIQILQTYSGSGDIGAFSGNVFQAYASDCNAAVYYTATAYNPTVATTITITGNLLLPNINGLGGSGSVFNCTTMNAFASVTVNHNTFNTDGSTYTGGLVIGDGNGVVAASTVASVRSNLAYSTISASGNYNAIYRHFSDAAVTDVCPPGMIGFNAGRNLHASNLARTVKPGYVQNGVSGTTFLFSTTPIADVTDLNVVPGFADSTRGVDTLYTRFFGRTTTGTKAGDFQATTPLLAANPSLIPYAVSWIKAGFAPTNPALRYAAHDGVTIGAIPFNTDPNFVNAYLKGK